MLAGQLLGGHLQGQLSSHALLTGSSSVGKLQKTGLQMKRLLMIPRQLQTKRLPTHQLQAKQLWTKQLQTKRLLCQGPLAERRPAKQLLLQQRPINQCHAKQPLCKLHMQWVQVLRVRTLHAQAVQLKRPALPQHKPQPVWVRQALMLPVMHVVCKEQDSQGQAGVEQMVAQWQSCSTVQPLMEHAASATVQHQ